MPERAQVTSIEAIEFFRASLIVFLSKARAGVEEVGDEIKRTRVWIETDRRAFWENECRRRQRALDEAEQELFSARLSRLHTQTAAQILAVERAKHSLGQAEEKRDLVKRWAREFENRAEPLGKQVEQLLTFLTTDLVKGAMHLSQILKSLDAYAKVGPGTPVLPHAEPAGQVAPGTPEALPAPPEAVKGGPQ